MNSEITFSEPHLLGEYDEETLYRSLLAIGAVTEIKRRPGEFTICVDVPLDPFDRDKLVQITSRYQMDASKVMELELEPVKSLPGMEELRRAGTSLAAKYKDALWMKAVCVGKMGDFDCIYLYVKEGLRSAVPAIRTYDGYPVEIREMGDIVAGAA